VAPTDLRFGANFAGVEGATAANTAGTDELTTTDLHFGQGALHMMQGPGSLPSFQAEKSPQIQTINSEGGMSFCVVCVLFCVLCASQRIVLCNKMLR
jgi:hypothetical protein